MGSDGRTAESAWAPLSHPVFRALWISSLVSNIGTWMQNVSAAWAMTSLSSSPLMIALVQSATSLPVFLVGLPAGAVADIVDRRRLLLVTQTWMLAAAAASIQVWVTSNSRRRSTMSATAPAGSPTKKTGRLVALCTRATISGDGESEVIDHAAPTFCIHVPTLEMSEAIHSARNTGCDSGAQAAPAVPSLPPILQLDVEVCGIMASSTANRIADLEADDLEGGREA